MKKHIIAASLLAVLALSIAAPDNALAQWTPPSATPPSGNVSAPVNTGSTAQVKNGGLSVNAFTAYLDSYFATKVGIGVVPTYKLDVAGAGSGNVAVRLTPDHGIVRLNGIDLLGYSSQDLWQIGNTSAVGLVLGTSWNWDTQVALRYSPGTIGAAGGVLTIGQTDKNSAGYTHGITRFFTNGSERVRIGSNGYVGINTTSPSYMLDVNGDVINNGWFRSRGNTGWYNESYGGGWYMQDTTWIRSYNSKPVYMSAGFDTGSASGVGCGGGLGGGYMFRVCGSVGAGSFFYTSDKSLKEDIKPLSGALQKVLKLEGVSFKWKEGGRNDIGVIAQDVEKVYPELVHVDADGKKSVEYGNLIAPLIEAIKEQQRQIDALRAEIESLKSTR